MRSRATRWRRLAGVPGGTSAMRPPPVATISSAKAAFALGLGTSTPEPRTAQVRPPRDKALRWATVSIPAASPEITAKPAATALLAAARATPRPKLVGWRVPTIATASVGGRVPRRKSLAGGDGIERRPAGYSGSSIPMTSAGCNLPADRRDRRRATLHLGLGDRPRLHAAGGRAIDANRARVRPRRWRGSRGGELRQRRRGRDRRPEIGSGPWADHGKRVGRLLAARFHERRCLSPLLALQQANQARATPRGGARPRSGSARRHLPWRRWSPARARHPPR